MYEKEIKSITRHYTRTCSVENIHLSKSVVFAKSQKLIHLAYQTNHEICLLLPSEYKYVSLPYKSNIEPYFIKEPWLEYVFGTIHNQFAEGKSPKENLIGKGCDIHPTVVIGVDGHKLITSPDGHRFLLKHMGNVVIGDDTKIDAYTVIHRSSLNSTVIGSNVILCTHINIAHNCVIGDNTFLAPGVKVAGSAKVGKNCWIWQGVLIKNGITIGDDVTVGMGSVVTRDLKEPGIYFGTPCRRVK